MPWAVRASGLRARGVTKPILGINALQSKLCEQLCGASHWECDTPPRAVPSSMDAGLGRPALALGQSFNARMEYLGVSDTCVACVCMRYAGM
jgi:hypothetical protein